MAYKTTLDKAQLIISCLTPPRVVLVSPPHMDTAIFREALIDVGYSIGTATARWSDQRCKLFCTTVTLLEELEKLTEPYALVYMYIHDRKKYASICHAAGVATDEIKLLIAADTERYKAFCEYMNDKVFTVLR
jgi:hypothetical protein